MSKIYIYLQAVACTLVLTACSSMFDNELPPHTLVGENAITNESSAEVALNGIYSYLRGTGTMSAFYISDNEFRTGLLNPESYYRTAESKQFPELQIEEEDRDVSSPWELAYQIVNSANNFIYYVEKLSESNFGAGRKVQLLAEARFMRAFGHTFLLRRFGYFWDINSPYGPIVRMEPSSLSNNSMSRVTVREAYEKIVEDFDYAINHGPAFYSKFQACVTSAKAFKADVLMNRGAEGDYAAAIALADEVIASPEFGLEQRYADIFSRGYQSKELLFTRFLKTPPTMDDNVGSLLKMFGGGTYAPSSYYMSVFPKEDTRYQTTFDSVELTKFDGSKYKRIIWKKHFVASGDCPMYYLRVAQMYLIKAEAMVYTNRSVKDVVDVLNILRAVRGNTLYQVSDFPDQESLVSEIFDENLRELGMENGAMYYLAVRMKIGNQRLLKTLNDNYEKDDQLCFPIPRAELEHNFRVEQKPL